MVKYNDYIKKAEDLVTTSDQTRNSFLKIALEKNKLSTPLVKQANVFKTLASKYNSADEPLNDPKLHSFLITASGVSGKASKYIAGPAEITAIKEFVKNFLKPAGKNFVEEAVYRFLLIKGDTLGGAIRNRIGKIGQYRLVEMLFSIFRVTGMDCEWLDNDSHKWFKLDDNFTDISSKVKAIAWQNNKGNRVLLLNTNIPTVGKNVDICLFDSCKDQVLNKEIVSQDKQAIMFGELKSGFDPAGADEHWKTGNTALERIRKSFIEKDNIKIKTSFIAAAIAKSMANEIYTQLETGTLSNAANLTNEQQLTAYCEWVINL